MPVFLVFVLILMTPFAVLAAPIPAEALSQGGNVTRSSQLKEIGDAVRPNMSGYIGFGTYWFLHPRQTALRSAYGKHDGFAFRQHTEVFFAAPLGESGLSLGLLWWLERHGFDTEDFLLFPKYGEFSLIRNVQTAGISLVHSPLQLGLAGGIQSMNPEYVSEKIYASETDSLYGFGYAFWGPLAARVAFDSDSWKELGFSLRLESKELYGGKSKGWRTYLPNFDVSLYKDASDSVRGIWEQNLFKQRLYGEVTAVFPDYGFYSAALKYYPDPSRLVSFEATCFKEENGDLTFGGGLQILMLRLAYNHVSDFNKLFHSHGTFVVELSFGLGSTKENFFGLNAAKAAPMESESRTIHESGSGYNPEANSTKNASGKKEITAKGIRRETVP